MIFFHQNLEYLRKGKRLSQAAMGKEFGISQTGYGRWEADTVPDLENIVSLARFFKISVDDFLSKDLKKSAYEPSAEGKDKHAPSGGLTTDEMLQIEQLEAAILAQKKLIQQMLADIADLKKESEAQSKELQALRDKD